MTQTEQIYTQKGRKIDFSNSNKTVINLGCGTQKYPGVKGMDILEKSGTDIVHDLAKFPWPIETSSVDLFLGFHVFEHLPDLNKTMVEIHRALKPGGRVIIEVPYFRHVGAFQDPTHCHFFTSTTMAYFHETPKRVTGLYNNAHYKSVGFWFGWPAKSKNPIINLFKILIQKYPKFYDEHLSKIFPVKVLVYELEAIK